MKRITISLTFDCRDDVPSHVIEWMTENLVHHALSEFGSDAYDSAFVHPEYEGPPLAEDGETTWQVSEVDTI